MKGRTLRWRCFVGLWIYTVRFTSPLSFLARVADRSLPSLWSDLLDVFFSADPTRLVCEQGRRGRCPCEASPFHRGAIACSKRTRLPRQYLKSVLLKSHWRDKNSASRAQTRLHLLNRVNSINPSKNLRSPHAILSTIFGSLMDPKYCKREQAHTVTRKANADFEHVHADSTD